MVKKTKATLKHIVTLIHLQKLKIGKAGITEGIINGIHERCGHCKKLAPEGKKATKNLQGKVKLAHVNYDDKKVQGFPTILVFGADKESPITYEGARTASAIESFALVQLETNVAPSEVTELTSSDVMEEKCGSAAICFVSFLLDILNSKAEGRNKYIEIHLSVAEKFKRSPYRFNWLHGQWRILEFFMLGPFI
ncbi:unnamed protein product [Lactuca saligna]|nr:unnamed protein product [Lactuca saligna]